MPVYRYERYRMETLALHKRKGTNFHQYLEEEKYYNYVLIQCQIFFWNNNIFQKIIFDKTFIFSKKF